MHEEREQAALPDHETLALDWYIVTSCRTNKIILKLFVIKMLFDPNRLLEGGSDASD